MSAALLALAAWAAHHAYYRYPDVVDRAWSQYIGTHGALVVLSLLLVPMAARLKRPALAAVGIGSCYLIALESAQCVGCGLLQWGAVVERDLCAQSFGTTPYAAAASALAATMGVIWWRRRRG